MINDDVKIETVNDRIYLISPYNPACVDGAHELGGKWDASAKAWAFDSRDRERVVKLAADVYGYSEGVDGQQAVTVRIDPRDHEDNEETDIVFAGRTIAHRPYRDSSVRLAANVVVVKGSFGSRGGSLAHPRVIDVDTPDDVQLEIRDIPASELKNEKNYTVVDGDPLKALEAKKAELEKQLKDINDQIEKMKGQKVSA